MGNLVAEMMRDSETSKLLSFLPCFVVALQVNIESYIKSTLILIYWVKQLRCNKFRGNWHNVCNNIDV